MDDDVARLVGEERIADAASLASARGDPRTASELFERACEWHHAAREAMHAGDPARAMRLAVLSGDEALSEKAFAALTSSAPDAGARAAAEHIAVALEARGDFTWAARLFESIGHAAEAARAWDRGGNAVRAAELLETLHDVVGAARVLEAATRRAPSHGSNYLALGALLLRYGKLQAAARALQAISADAAERKDALRLLVQALEQLGLDQAAREARRELEALGSVATEMPEMPSLGERLPSARIYGRYEVLREVASTAGSRVIECVDGVRSEHVAIKIYAGYGARGAGRDVLARFERELRVLASLDHPNVVPLLDYFPDGPALVLAWMPGGTLEQMLERGPIAPSRAVEIACAILAALDEAHRLGVLHRDIKPSNVLFDAAGAARLADFGAAHLGDLSATATAGIIGTLSYMSPEQRNGEPASITSDVYGVGALLFEMLTGEHVPHDGSSPRAPSLWHPDLDARHDAVALSLLAPEPAARPSDARVARRALTALAWPASPGTLVKRAPPSSSSIAADETSAAGRVRAGAPGEPDVDTWLQRPILRIPLDPLSLARAAAFARADHALLQRVFRVDRRAGEIWLDANDAGPLARPLTADERAVLSDALDALHRTGTTHGKVDRDHIRLQNDGTPTLAFTPECGPAAIMDDDHSALSRL